MFLGDPPLPLIGRAVAVDVGHRGQFVGTVQRLRDRLQPGQQVGEVLGDQPLVAVGVQDDHRVQAVARGAPLVLLHMPGRHGRQRLAGVQPTVQVDDQAVRQCDQRAQLTQVGHAVEDPHLEGAQMRRRPDVPTDFVHVVDDAGLLLVVDEALELRPGLKVERQPGGRQLLKHHRPVAGVAGVLAAPARRRRRQRQQVRVVVEQRRHDRHHLGGRRDPDVHVDAPDQHLPAPPLGALDQLGVARRVGQLLGRPPRERVGAGAEQLHAAVAHDLAGGAQGLAKIVHRLGGAVADAGDDLDGVAQQFLVHARVFADLGDDRGGFVAQVTGRGVDERELPLDAEGRPG